MIIDTDCGIDDAIAIMMALGSDRYSVTGITTLSGNVPVAQVTDNVLRLLAYLGRDDLPVFVGASGPYVGEARSAAGIHGENGLGGIELPASAKSVEKMSGPDAIFELAAAHPGCTLVTLGPLTNLAMALNLHPQLKERLGRVVAMGGAIERGNATQYAEFNFYADPESVQAVLDSGMPLEVATWDACVQTALTGKQIEEAGGGSSSVAAEAGGGDGEGGRACELFGRLAGVLLERVEALFGLHMVPLADPLAMAYALSPDIAVQTLRSGLVMELMPTVMRGKSALCEGGETSILVNAERKRFVHILKTHLARAG